MTYVDSPAKPSSRQRLFLILGIVLIGANLRAPITSLGPILPQIQEALGLGSTAAGVLNALPLLIFALLSLLAPALGRGMGLERSLALSLASIFVGTVIRSLPAPGLIWFGTLVLSAGIAIANVLLPGLVKRDFAARASGVIGAYAAAMAITAGLAAGLAPSIAEHGAMGWRWALGLWAALALVALLVWLPQRSPGRRAPAFAVPRATVSPWRSTIGWYVSLFFAFHSFVFYSVVDWFGSYAAASGVSADSAGMYMLIYQVVAVFTNLGCAPFIGRFGSQVGMGAACGVLLLVGTVGLLCAPTWAMIWLIFAGLGAGLSLLLSLSFFALRTTDHHQAAALSGMAQFVGYLGAAAGPMLIGVIQQLTGRWEYAWLLLVAASAVVLLFASLAGRSRSIGA